MIEKIKALCIRYREIIVYIIVGGLTTVVGWGSKFLWNILFYGGTAFPTSLQNAILSVVEWVAGVAFAYPTNRRWVFQSRAELISPGRCASESSVRGEGECNAGWTGAAWESVE